MRDHAQILRRFIGLAAVTLTAAINPLSAQTDAAWDVTTPRGETRTISFTTDEGTWMSVDVSPDGRTLAFDMVGEIWLLPIEGGEARPITKASGIALNYHPAFSPDGSTIAFISDRDGQDNVWLMDV
ncbi:MAG: PD40 domain-containing protein, partial [Gemmatimonadetes bacterium]|nr:PD40 domain-containing protein [Gemmatimonadota bacterium]